MAIRVSYFELEAAIEAAEMHDARYTGKSTEAVAAALRREIDYKGSIFALRNWLVEHAQGSLAIYVERKGRYYWWRLPLGHNKTPDGIIRRRLPPVVSCPECGCKLRLTRGTNV